jgi:hypothetical protein
MEYFIVSCFCKICDRYDFLCLTDTEFKVLSDLILRKSPIHQCEKKTRPPTQCNMAFISKSSYDQIKNTINQTKLYSDLFEKKDKPKDLKVKEIKYHFSGDEKVEKGVVDKIKAKIKGEVAFVPSPTKSSDILEIDATGKTPVLVYRGETKQLNGDDLTSYILGE